MKPLPRLPALPPLLPLLLFLVPASPGQENAAAPPNGLAPAGVPGAAPAAPPATFSPTRLIRMRPDEKRPLVLKESERNPYAKRNPQEEVAAQETVDAEELRIRERIGALRVTGRSRGPRGLRVLLGNLILEQGRVLPQLIEGQVEGLRVVELGEDEVKLGWIDPATGRPTGKTMQIAYDLAPSVSFALQGPEEGEEVPMGVIRVAPGRGSSGSGMAGPPANRISPEVFDPGR